MIAACCGESVACLIRVPSENVRALAPFLTAPSAFPPAARELDWAVADSRSVEQKAQAGQYARSAEALRGVLSNDGAAGLYRGSAQAFLVFVACTAAEEQ